jgi:O-antigen ligase
MTVLAFAMVMNRRQAINRWTGIAIVAIALCALALFQLNGAALKNNLTELAPGDNALGLRNMLWAAAVHMIWDAPQLGIGLGGFEHAYPLYADHVYPYNIDKAHNDHLELAVGWGLPAAIAWWGALLWLAVKSARGVLTRRRDQIYPLIAVGATVLVAVHSIFDFTLQLPAVALIYVLILGCGVAQSFSSRS